jgi:LysR family transcriptional regulator, low CO2-responsive transcriptional regulator
LKELESELAPPSASDAGSILFRRLQFIPPVTILAKIMDFDQLETFLEVAKLLSFSRAAEKRFRTQPAISSQIRALEEEVEAKLLDRSGGKVSITASGKLFQQFAEDMVAERKSMLAAIAETERVPRGGIVVGANEGTCLHILPEVFAEFKRQWPDVAIGIKRADYAKILESVIDNSVDFGVVSLPVEDKRLKVVLIHRDELVIIAPPKHALAKVKAARVEKVAEFPLVMPKAGHTRDALEGLFYERKLKPRFAMELDSSELLKRFVAAGAGVGFIARSNVLEDILAKALVAVPMEDAKIRRDLALVFRKDKALSRAALAFIDITVKIKGAAAVSG